MDEHFCVTRFKKIEIVVYHDDMKAVREMLDDEVNKLTLAAFFEYCSRIDATVMVRAAGTWAKRELKRANELIDFYGIAMTKEQEKLLEG